MQPFLLPSALILLAGVVFFSSALLTRALAAESAKNRLALSAEAKKLSSLLASISESFSAQAVVLAQAANTQAATSAAGVVQALESVLAELRIPGPIGAPGAQGERGERGPQGIPGLVNVQVETTGGGSSADIAQLAVIRRHGAVWLRTPVGSRAYNDAVEYAKDPSHGITVTDPAPAPNLEAPHA